MNIHKLFFYIRGIRLVPHLLAFLFGRRIVMLDMQAWEEAISNNPYRHGSVMSYCWLLDNLLEYRSLLYYRFGSFGKLLNLFAPSMPTCFLTEILSKNIGKGMVIHHGHSMRLGAAMVGENLHIWHNVTIGKSKPGGCFPRIGNNVKIYAGAAVLGDITIGDNVVIAACSVVLKSVPSGCVVAGNPARIVKRNNQKCNESL